MKIRTRKEKNNNKIFIKIENVLSANVEYEVEEKYGDPPGMITISRKIKNQKITIECKDREIKIEEFPK